MMRRRGQRPPLDAAGPRRGARDRGRRRQRRRRRARAASSGMATPYNDAVVELVHSMERGERSPDPRWLREVVPPPPPQPPAAPRDSSPPPPPTRPPPVGGAGGGTTSGRRRPRARPTAESPRRPGGGCSVGSKQWSPSLPGISRSRTRKPTAWTATPTSPKTAGVVEAVPARAGEVDREVQDQARATPARTAVSRPAPGLPSITSWPSLPGVSRSRTMKPDDQDGEPDARVGEDLQDELEHLCGLPLSRR